MAKRKKKLKQGRPILFALFVLASITLLTALLLRGKDIALFNPKGYIASEEHKLFIFSVGVLLDLAIPTLALFYLVAWKYRETNDKAAYNPAPRNDKMLVFGIWAVPSIFMVLLAATMWPATHKLAPQKLIDAGVKPLTVKVIAMRWKWLFIYPEQEIATVNYIQIPTNVPVQFDITADETPMSSFWIPHLSGQLYAMTGHVNRLNIVADTPGDYNGSSAEINGSGFAGMKFMARAGSIHDFELWVEEVKRSSAVLTAAEYQKLLSPSEYNHAAFYAQAGPDIYANMLTKYAGSHGSHEHQTENE